MANIFGINLNDLPSNAVTKKISEFLSGQTQHYIVTPNPEIILAAHQDEELFYVLNKASLALADGFGLKIAGFLFGYNLPRLTGADLTVDLLKLASKEGTKTIILNWEKGLSSQEEISSALTIKFPGLDFLVLNIGRDKFLRPETVAKIKEFSPTLLFNNLGFPYQEKLLHHNLKDLPSVKVALAVGGSFDFITGRAQRAPKVWRNLGLEWLWRLIKHPQRAGRIYNATVVFLKKILASRFINPFLYRDNVVGLLYKKESDRFKILLVEREGDSNHWQLPQGGTDGEDIETAGRRELREEVGTDKFATRASFKNLYRYDFGPDTGYKKYKFDYKGQRQSLYIAEFSGQDSDIKINFWDHSAWKWVDAEQLIAEVHPVRRDVTKLFLEKFESLKL